MQQNTLVQYRDDYGAVYAGTIPTPPKREFALFTLVQGSTIQKRMSENGAVEMVEVFPGVQNLPMMDVILNKEGNPEYIHFHQGVSTRTNPDGTQISVYNYPAIVFEKGKLQVNVKTQRKLFEYMMVCNFNVDNIHRNKNVLGMFRYVDEESIQEKRVAEYKDKMDFQNRIWSLDPELLNVVADRFHYNVQGSPEYVKQHILESIDSITNRDERIRTREKIDSFLVSTEIKRWGQFFKMKANDRITFNDSLRVWKYKTGTEDVILTVPSNIEDKELYLIEYLSDHKNKTAVTAWVNVLKGIKS